jgi:hypothetical protein
VGVDENGVYQREIPRQTPSDVKKRATNWATFYEVDDDGHKSDLIPGKATIVTTTYRCINTVRLPPEPLFTYQNQTNTRSSWVEINTLKNGQPLVSATMNATSEAGKVSGESEGKSTISVADNGSNNKAVVESKTKQQQQQQTPQTTVQVAAGTSAAKTDVVVEDIVVSGRGGGRW